MRMCVFVCMWICVYVCIDPLSSTNFILHVLEIIMIAFVPLLKSTSECSYLTHLLCVFKVEKYFLI